MSRPSTASARRLRGLLLAALLCASQAGAWLHESVVAHVTCLEHGETIHTGPSQGPAPPTPALFARLSGDPGAQPDAHEHCGGGALLRARGVAIAAPADAGALTPPAFPPPPTHDRSNTALLGAGVYLVAPKTSPPSAGA